MAYDVDGWVVSQVERIADDRNYRVTVYKGGETKVVYFYTPVTVGQEVRLRR